LALYGWYSFSVEKATMRTGCVVGMCSIFRAFRKKLRTCSK